MSHSRATHRRAFLQTLIAAGLAPLPVLARQGSALPAPPAAGHHVHPGDRIQDALDAAARDPVNKTVYVHAGTYRPAASGQALVWFNAPHDGVTLEAIGDVTLTAANPDLANPRAASAPAVVNHVVYFGDGISRRTALRGFRITGANNFTTGSGERSPIESDEIRKTAFFYTDGGGLKIYARSYPTIERVEVFDNYASPCGGGVSVEHLGQTQDSVLFRDCIFRNNRTQTTGAAVDLLHGSRATIDNCLFVGNVSNMGVDYVGLLTGGEYHPRHGSGALTVFAGSRATVSRSTFTDNWNGVDDDGAGSAYVDCIFWTQHPARRHFAGAALRARPHGRFRRPRLLHSRRGQRSQGVDCRGAQHARCAGPAVRRPVRPEGAAVRRGRIPAGPGRGVRAGDPPLTSRARPPLRVRGSAAAS